VGGGLWGGLFCEKIYQRGREKKECVEITHKTGKKIFEIKLDFGWSYFFGWSGVVSYGALKAEGVTLK